MKKTELSADVLVPSFDNKEREIEVKAKLKVAIYHEDPHPTIGLFLDGEGFILSPNNYLILKTLMAELEKKISL